MLGMVPRAFTLFSMSRINHDNNTMREKLEMWKGIPRVVSEWAARLHNPFPSPAF